MRKPYTQTCSSTNYRSDVLTPNGVYTHNQSNPLTLERTDEVEHASNSRKMAKLVVSYVDIQIAVGLSEHYSIYFEYQGY